MRKTAYYTDVLVVIAAIAVLIFSAVMLATAQIAGASTMDANAKSAISRERQKKTGSLMNSVSWGTYERT